MNARELERRLSGSMKLVQLTRELAGHHELDEILTCVTRDACEALSCQRATLYRYDEQRRELYSGSVTKLELPEIRTSVDMGVCGWVARTRSIANIQHPESDARWNSQFDRLTGFQTRNILAAPVLSPNSDQLLGVLQLLNKRTGDFDSFDEQLLQAFAAHAGTALERSGLLAELRRRQELELAVEVGRRIQHSFLPDHLPDIAGYEIGFWWQPAESVSGDYYDIIPLPDGRVGLVIADVSGHGVGPSLIMASVRAMVHVLARTRSDLHLMINLVGETIAPDLQEGRFITFLMGALDPRRHRLQYANAGHGPALHFDRHKQKFHSLQSTGLPLGFDTRLEASQLRTIKLQSGDLLLLATDGLTEVRSPGGEMFGRPRLEALIIEHRRLPARELVEYIRQSVLDFAGGDDLQDDVTLVAVERKL